MPNALLHVTPLRVEVKSFRFVLLHPSFDIKFHRGSELWIPYAPVFIAQTNLSRAFVALCGKGRFDCIKSGVGADGRWTMWKLYSKMELNFEEAVLRSCTQEEKRDYRPSLASPMMLQTVSEYSDSMTVLQVLESEST